MSFEAQFFEGWGTASFEGLFTDWWYSPIGGDGSPAAGQRVKLVPGMNGVFLVANQKLNVLVASPTSQELIALVLNQQVSAPVKKKTLSAPSKTQALEADSE